MIQNRLCMTNWIEILKDENDVIKITFVCTGNIIRSAYSEYLAKKYFQSKNKSNLLFDSGACKHQNSYMYPLTKKLLLQEGYSEEQLSTFKPRLIQNYFSEFEKSTMFIAMTQEHLNYIEKKFPGKGFLIKEIVLGKKEDVLDPYYFSEKENEIMAELKGLVIDFCKKIDESIK